MVGVVIGSYQLVRKLGEGGMGAVYLGQHQLLGRRAAIKVLLPELSARPDIVNRFFNEARAVTSISDPGIVQVFDFGYHTDGSAFIVMEYLEGEPLDRRLARFGRIAAPQALRLARQVATSLAAAHAQQIVHRDLKPENIFLVHDAEVASGERSKILDFGIAKLSDNHPGKLKTHAGALMGTPVYMSPEQCRGLVEVDHRSDIYSLGCVLFHLLTGRPPFDGEAPGDIMSAHIREPAPVASSRAPEIAPSIDALVMRCLAKAPAERFQTMLELTAALGAVLQQLPGGGQVSGAPAYHMMPTTQVSLGGTPVAPTTLGMSTGQSVPLARPPRRVGLWIAGGLVVAAALGGIAIVRSHGARDQRIASTTAEVPLTGDASASASNHPGAAAAPVATSPAALAQSAPILGTGAGPVAGTGASIATQSPTQPVPVVENAPRPDDAPAVKIADTRPAGAAVSGATAAADGNARTRGKSGVAAKAGSRTKTQSDKAAADASGRRDLPAGSDSKAAGMTKEAAGATPDAAHAQSTPSMSKPAATRCSKASFAAV
ncbi:MAG TPA: protein kinase, partial [Kofleriaceae bacterium]|nr:protein kinase [Kofleriaceae bacterium]